MNPERVDNVCRVCRTESCGESLVCFWCAAARATTEALDLPPSPRAERALSMDLAGVADPMRIPCRPAPENRCRIEREIMAGNLWIAPIKDNGDDGQPEPFSEIEGPMEGAD